MKRPRGRRKRRIEPCEYIGCHEGRVSTTIGGRIVAIACKNCNGTGFVSINGRPQPTEPERTE